MHRTTPTSPEARAWGRVRPLNRFEGIMLQVPTWRCAPFEAPAAFDENLCTDSVLPGSFAPGPVTPRLGFVATSLRYSLVLENWMGPFPALTTLRNSILTGLSGRLCPRFEGSNSCVMRPGKPLAESPGYYRRRPICSTFLRRHSWDLCKKIVFREPCF